MTSHHFHIILLIICGVMTCQGHVPAAVADDDSSATAEVHLSRSGSLGQMIPVVEAIATFQERVRKKPQDQRSRMVLGQLYVRLAKETGRHSAYASAEKVFRQALVELPESSTVKTHLAAVLEAQHQFEEALQLSESACLSHPSNTSALATAFDCQMALGRYAAADTSLQKLKAAEGSIPPVQARQAQLAEIQGKPREAIVLLEAALATSIEHGTSTVSWYQFRLGTLFDGQGELNRAAEHYQKAMTADSSFLPAKISLARVTALQGQLMLAEDLYREVLAFRPSAAAYIGLSDVLSIAGQKQQAETCLDRAGQLMDEEYQALPDCHSRQLSRFHSDYQRDTALSLQLAEQDLRIRQDIYAYDTLAWALLKCGRAKEALIQIQKALSMNTQDALLHFHAGMIYVACGDRQQAIRSFETALAINGHFDLRQAEMARRQLSTLAGLTKF